MTSREHLVQNTGAPAIACSGESGESRPDSRPPVILSIYTSGSQHFCVPSEVKRALSESSGDAD